MCEIPVDKELDLKKAAKHFGEKAGDAPLDFLTAFPAISRAVLPVGMKKVSHRHRCICGATGERSPSVAAKSDCRWYCRWKALQEITGAQFVDLTVDK